MNHITRHKGLQCLVIALVIGGMASAAARAEERTMTAFSPITTTGQLLQTGSNLASFAGIATGIMIVESDRGLANAGNVSCTINLEMSSADDGTNGVGRCSVIGSEGNRLYGAYTCTGILGFGCKGEFTIDGGTGEFADAKGSGEFLIRSLVAETAFSIAPTELNGAADGIAMWQGIKLTVEAPAPVNN